MTLGTNASLAEQIEYAPSEINFGLLSESLEELEGWREQFDDFDGPASVQDRLDDLESDIETKDKVIEELEAEVDELSEEISYLKNKVEELECALEDAENQA